MRRSLFGVLASIYILLSGVPSGFTQTIQKNDYVFTFSAKISCGPVEDQGSTGTCWSFSTASFLESEMVRTGKQLIDLSEMFYVRLNYLEKADLYLRYQGKNNFGEGSLSHDILRLYQKYGAIPESVYSGLVGNTSRHSHGRMEGLLKKYLDNLISGREIPANWRDGYIQILDEHLGPLPATFIYEGRTWDPKTFAKEFVGLNASDYVSLTSFSHHPLYESFVLEIPDNYVHASFFNVRLADLTEITSNALEKGYSVVWDCDVSEKGFSARQGLAIVPSEEVLASRDQNPFELPTEEMEITPELRQLEFDSYGLTDDHLMHLVGVAKDQKGNDYYYVKNSWGEAVGLDGYLFASKSYFELNTISITVHKDVIPETLSRKIGLPTNESLND
ncbi:MAG: aminopeptidase [Saprospiraceae bacterium]|nr:aminopeptidase [Saprospiraceae bacterium]